ncbi:hypothetical protein Tco_0284384, partial [Tanacetum coccineum]
MHLASPQLWLQIQQSNANHQKVKSCDIKSFGEKVCNIRICVNLDNLFQSFLITISYKMESNLNMFGPRISNKILDDTYSALIINMDFGVHEIETITPLHDPVTRSLDFPTQK